MIIPLFETVSLHVINFDFEICLKFIEKYKKKLGTPRFKEIGLYRILFVRR